jgi:hypothetical protein
MDSADRMSARVRLLWLTLWSAAFGVTEGAVVVYLRRIIYPGRPADGPLFPLRFVDPALLGTEIAREAATLVMLLGVAMLAERRPLKRFGAFAFCFGIWDLAYYAALRVWIGWPQSLLTWDVLFLIPKPWAAPVLAPVLVSLGLVVGGALLVARVADDGPHPFRVHDGLIQVACGVLILASFFWTEGSASPEAIGHYPWWLFLAGWFGGLFWGIRALRPAPRR